MSKAYLGGPSDEAAEEYNAINERIVSFRQRFRDIRKHTDEEFYAYYRGYAVEVMRNASEENADLGNWYITVCGRDGCYLYDGWWPDSDIRSIEDAAMEALYGAMLLPRPNRSQAAQHPAQEPRE